MKLTTKTILALGILAGGVSFAQTPADARLGNGLLGERYSEFNFGVQDIKHVSNHGYDVGASANNPLLAGVLDAGASYSYSWIRGAFNGHANTIGAYATAYTALQGVKPFVSSALGYQWVSSRFGSDEQTLWGLSTGVEIPAGVATITPRISYADDFEGSRASSQQWTFAVEANYWFNKRSSVFGSIGKSDILHSSLSSWNYEIGLRSRF